MAAACLSVTGLGGAPPPEDAGNVLRAYTEAALSLRLPPGVDAEPRRRGPRAALTTDPPAGATVDPRRSSRPRRAGPPRPPPPWLAAALDDGVDRGLRPAAGSVGVGGSIPFMAMLGERFPDAQFVVTGVLVPGSNAHGPNEFLHIPTGKSVTAAVATVLAAHAER